VGWYPISLVPGRQVKHTGTDVTGFPEPIAHYRALPSPKRNLERARGTQEFYRSVAQRWNAFVEFTTGVSEMRIEGHRLGREASNAAKLLAMHEVR
jgi:hypothetical protein